MAPGGNKRKRPERQSSRDEGHRRSPYRPQDQALAQQSPNDGGGRGGRGGRRPSRQMAQSPVNGASRGSGNIRNTASESPAPALQQQQQPHGATHRDSPAVDASRSETPSQMAPAISQPPVDDTPKQPPAPYWYEHITSSVVEAWEESGRNMVLEMAKEADEMTISTLIQELVRAGLDGNLNAFEAGAAIRQIIAQHSDADDVDVQSLFLNTLSLLDESDMKGSNFLTLVAATDIDPEVVRLELDIPLLQALALVRSSFTQMRTRKTTNILYRQANFNLLREETEGYAKLVTEYFNTANEATHDHTVSAERAFERITALVGSFDLDVGRVLDITLDISANLLVRAYGFFIKFYRCSSWWPDSGIIDNVRWEDQGFGAFPSWALPGADHKDLTDGERAALKAEEAIELAEKKDFRDIRFWDRVKEVGMDAFFELGMRKIIDLEEVLPLLNTEVSPEVDARGKEINGDRRKRINENRKFMAETGMLPPPGNSDAAQLLGFKLRFYASSARDAQDVLPENLIFLAALLIKIGFISLRDLYPHLYPEDESMADEKKRLEKEKADKEAKERPGVASNALAMAGALTDDTVPVAAARALRSDKEKSGGSTPRADKKDEESKDELPPPVNQKVQLLKALLLIGAIPEALYILGRFPWLAEVDYSLPPYLHRIANQMLSKVAASIRPLNKPDDAQIPRAEVGNLIPRVDGTLNFQPRPERKSTRWLGLDTVEKTDGLQYKHYYPDWDDNIPRCQTVEDVVLLCNSFLGYLGVKIGQDAKLLDTLVRVAKYSLSEDFSGWNQARWLDLMRRLFVPALSLSKHNAGLTQEVYELLMFFPTTTRYNIYTEWYRGKTSRLPDMRAAFEHNKAEVKDVLRRVTNESGKKQARALAKVSFSSPGNVMIMMISQLESYSNMIPSLVECTRYFSLLAYDVLTWCLINSLSGQGRDRMQADGMLTSPWLQALSQFVASLFYRYTALNPSPVLQYLASELRAGNSTDLEMFEQLLAEMAGIRSDMEFNDAQVLAMAGGKHLQAQTVQQLADKRHDRKPQAQRLIKALSDPGLIGQTLISIAQERQMYPYHDSSKYMPLKVLGNNLDKIHLVFAQYLDVLRTNLNPVEFEAAVPDVVSLVGDFGLEPGLAFTICRASIAQRVLDYDSAKKSELDEKKRHASEDQAQTNDDVDMQGIKIQSSEGQDPTDPVDQKTLASSQPTAPDGEMLPWHPVLQPIIQQLAEVSPSLADRVSIPFYVSFWTRALQEILVHTPSYDGEINKLRAQSRELNADRADLGASALKERERKKKAFAETQDKLRDELKGRIATYQKTRNRISRQEKDHWFSRSMNRQESDARHIGLLQECFLPRSMLSSLDAHYCYLMLKILHDNGTPGFSTMRFLAQLFRKQELATLIAQCTAMEAQHFGRFMNETLKLLHHWHSDRSTYEREALGEKQKLPGFAKTLDANGDPLVVLEFEEYRRLLFNWHSYLNGALQTCFESTDYMPIRNGIIVLRSIVQVFPSLNFMGHNMAKLVTKLSEDESRNDLKLAAKSLLGPLKNREKQWLMPQAFRLNDPAKEPVRSASRAPSARPESPQPGAGTPKLNASAPEFKPTSNVANGTLRHESITGTEDGEIEDEKQAGVKDGGEAKDETEAKAVTEESTSTKETTKEVDDSAKTSASTEAKKEAPKVASKPSTPAPIPSKPPPPEFGRSEQSRGPPLHSASSRSHALPSRPPSKPLPLPPGPERSSGRYGGRDESFGRLSRPADVRPASRDHSPGRSVARTPERDGYHGHSARGSTRDDRGPPRNLREESWANSRRDQPPATNPNRSSHESRDRTSDSYLASSAQAPHLDRTSYANPSTPGSATQQGSRQPPSGPQSAQSARGDGQYHENPARMALINNDHTRDKDSRGDREIREDRSRALPRENRPDQASDLAPTGPRRTTARLSRDIGHGNVPESTNGRLNGPPEFPSPLRPPNGPSGRSTRQAPDRRASGQQFDRPSSSNSVPTTPSAEDGPAVHPSRLGRVEVQPPPIQTNVSTSAPRNASSPTVAPPSGPRGANRLPPGTPTGPSPANSGPPTGPAASSERPRRPDRRHASEINATLQGANNLTSPNGQSVNFRGAAQSRPPSSLASAATNAPPVQAVASSIDAPPRRNEPSQPPRAERVGRTDPQADLFQSKHGPGGENDASGRPRRGEDERMHRERNSRNPSREPNLRAPVEDSANRRGEDWRTRDDRDGPPRTSRFPDRGPRTDDLPSRRGPPSAAPSSFSEQPQDWGRPGERRGQPPRDAVDDDRRGGPMPDFRGGRREDDRRDGGRPPRDFEGPPPPGTRKRRHEDVPFDESKRRRSGR